jgi:hypothetical protein
LRFENPLLPWLEGVDVKERGNLSEERLRLIRSFMGEPLAPGEAEPNLAAEVVEAEIEADAHLDLVDAEPPQPLRDEPRAPRIRSGTIPRMPSVARARRDLRWPLAAVAVGVFVGVVMSHAV